MKSSRTILEQEVREAEVELVRPVWGLLVAGLMGGLAMGIGLLLMGVVLTLAGDSLESPRTAFVLANAHTVGFILVIMGRTDLFTEYTALAVLPVLEGTATTTQLARFWGVIYAANLAGVMLFALAILWLGPSLGVVDPSRVGPAAHRLLEHGGGTMLVSATIAGWMMGLLAWLVTSGRDTISQVFFVWLVTLIIALAHLHHSVSGFALVFLAWLEGGVTGFDLGRFVFWVTVGNAVGGVVFAVLTRFRTSTRSR